ncbi:MAG TPA: MOSC domain-containing protein [Gemmatimonadaceae bacterium]|nr:MOSC domain-containing protein [Gemmatimonadaceae bacterium]
MGEMTEVAGEGGAQAHVGTVEAVNVSNGGVPKRSVARARVSVTGVEGDRQRDLRFHGGPDRAVCLYSADLIDALAAEGAAIGPGAVGENLTLRGIPWDAMVVGTRVTIGEVEAVVTGYASPCANLRPVFGTAAVTRISQKVRPGWSRVYARVVQEGVVAAGDAVRVVPPQPAAERQRGV